MAIITRAQLDSVQLRTQLVDVPEWATAGNPNPQVLVRELMGSERDQYEASLMTMTGKGKSTSTVLHLQNARAKLAALAMIDEAGNRLYTDKPADVQAIGKLPARGLERVCDAIMGLSGINDESVEALETAAVNFPNGETSGFGTN